jgi:undecaprenyl-phosphate galactose phosphotransferase/putative colanic acid biosynthesis UDP-glucose lipid carrier transferase
MSIGSNVSEHRAGLERPSKWSQVSFSFEAIAYVLRTTDALVILLSGLFGAFFYHWVSQTPLPNLVEYYALGLIASFLYIVRQNGRGYYAFECAAKPDVEITEVLVSWLVTTLVLALFAFLLKIGVAYSRGAFLFFVLVAAGGLLASRRLSKKVLRTAVDRRVIGRRDALLVGDAVELAALEDIDLLRFFGTGNINRFQLAQESDPLLQQSSDVKTLNAVANFVRKNNSAEILLALPWHDTVRIGFIRDQLKCLPVSAKLLPDTQIRTLTNYASSAGQQVLSVEIQRAPLSRGERMVKRTVDIVLGLLALIAFTPIMAMTAVAIKLEGPGPIFFRQSRKGFNGVPFVMLKFRSMSVQENGATVTQATRDDPRVTTIGRILRASSIDELPQLINVLRGEMSLIGPRPHALAHDDYFDKVVGDYAFRHHVKPGMTGWAQVNGLRGATPTVDLIAKRVKMDLWYINNWSPWLDLQIVGKTFFEVLRKRNAY